MSMSPQDSQIVLRDNIRLKAQEQGFDICRITNIDALESAGNNDIETGLYEFLQAHHHGDMDWLARDPARRAYPKNLWQDVRSIIVLGVNYAPAHNPLEDKDKTDKGLISVYAQRRDYHDVIKKRLRPLARWLAESSACEVKLFVDTAPVMEKPLAAAAGLGWQGKHTNLVSPDYGSWLFLGVIFAACDLPADEAGHNQCGSCRACLDVCPTNAFTAPYKLDARKCISYLTIEHKGAIDRALRPAIGNYIYGCDDCLAVCPWNKFARTAHNTRLAMREDLHLPDLLFLITLDDAAFRTYFTATPIKRVGRVRFMRNVLIAIGNMADDVDEAKKAEACSAVKKCLSDEAALVRGMAVWALAQLDKSSAITLARPALADERDAHVLEEWQAVLA
ncbi:MAG: tRNA epoxyqueuosine(34) reductase QueG [Alphaproteobacteria bacterium]|nr:tRNA epoxyqueuosine(34) reductase QueG [Alphaproteobacteria bacterium]